MGRGGKLRHNFICGFFNAFEFFIARIKLFLLGFFGRKCLNYALAKQTVLNLRVKFAYLHTLIFKGGAHFSVKVNRYDYH